MKKIMPSHNDPSRIDSVSLSYSNTHNPRDMIPYNAEGVVFVAGFVIDPEYQARVNTSAGQKLVESCMLLIVHRRLQLLINTIQERSSQDNGQGLVTLLPSQVRIGSACIPMLVRLQAAVLSIIDDFQQYAPVTRLPSLQIALLPTTTVMIL